jgi:two-component system, sensor histidine kinase and response regulator
MNTPADKKYTMLIVDDVPENIQVISSILYKHGINISIAQSGGEAFSILAHRIPDLILLDIMMPDMNGFEVCQRLKEDARTSEIPVIFLTAKTNSDDILKGFALGAVDYVTKPFNKAELLSRVNTHLELKHARDTIKAQNQQLLDQNQALAETNATKDKFFSIIAHDLRNPFNTILTLSGMLHEELSTYTFTQIERYARMLYTASEQVYRLLENLLEWSRSQTDRIEFYPECLPVRNLIADAFATLQSQASDKHVQLHSDLDDKDLYVWADMRMISTILRNLVSNAIKYTECGGEVRVSAHQADDGVEFAVTDTGVGIAPEDVETLFQIDRHYSTVGTAQEKGSGLGLILCKEFLARHGGTIRAESEVGRGSRFTFTLPNKPPATSAAENE